MNNDHWNSVIECLGMLAMFAAASLAVAITVGGVLALMEIAAQLIIKIFG